MLLLLLLLLDLAALVWLELRRLPNSLLSQASGLRGAGTRLYGTE